MRVYKTSRGIIVNQKSSYFLIKNEDWDKFINNDNLYGRVKDVISLHDPIENASELIASELEAPLQSQEIWASGVTYYKSKQGRKEESKEAGGSDYHYGHVYDDVYDAERPELFFKSTKHRTVGSQESVRIRRDSAWNVPEPELTLVVTSNGKIVGYTIGNDMSSRSIEGENPLYLPQAKCYDGSASVGPCVYVTDNPLPPKTKIEMQVERDGATVFEGNVQVGQIKRDLTDLVSYLYRECTFPYGCLLMTGTGIVPDDEFTLHYGDEIRIRIAPIGTLVNTVV